MGETNMPAVRWQEFNRSNLLVGKQKEFQNVEQMKRFTRKLEKKDNFSNFLAFDWSDK